jgi:hypothetical protein
MDNDWRITPCDNGDYLLTRPGDNQPWMRCYPSDGWRVEIIGQPRRLNLQEWHLARQRVITLVECARTDLRVQRGEEILLEGPQEDTVCTNCQSHPMTYVGWGMPCTACVGGHYMPSDWREEPTGDKGQASVPLSFRVPQHMRESVEELAKSAGVPLSVWLRTAFADYLARERLKSST